MVYHKPSYEPYYLPFNSVHPLHMKKNIPFAMLLRYLRYCSTFETYLHERESLRMALLLNKYPSNLINDQFNRVFLKFEINQPLTVTSFKVLREKLVESTCQYKPPTDHGKAMFIHFAYCKTMRTFLPKFHALWHKYFEQSPISEVTPVSGTRNVANLQKRLMHTQR